MLKNKKISMAILLSMILSAIPVTVATATIDYDALNWDGIKVINIYDEHNKVSCNFTESNNDNNSNMTLQVKELSSFSNVIEDVEETIKEEDTSLYKKLNDARDDDYDSRASYDIDEAWKEFYSDDYSDLYNTEYKYIEKSFYDNLIEKLFTNDNFKKLISKFSVNNKVL